jgi:hypothetical protein
LCNKRQKTNRNAKRKEALQLDEGEEAFGGFILPAINANTGADADVDEMANEDDDYNAIVPSYRDADEDDIFNIDDEYNIQVASEMLTLLTFEAYHRWDKVDRVWEVRAWMTC